MFYYFFFSFCLFLIDTRGVRDQLIGHLIPEMVVVFKPDPKNKYAVTVEIVIHIFDVTTSKPQFVIDLVLGSCSDPVFIHHYTQYQNMKNIKRVCVCGVCVWCVCVVCVCGVYVWCVCVVCGCGVCVYMYIIKY